MKTKRLLVLAALAAMTVSCSKETGSDQPTSSEFASYTGEATDVIDEYATVSGKAKINGGVSVDTKFGILYSKNSDIVYGSADVIEVMAESFDSDYNYRVETSGMDENTTYYFRAYLYHKGKIYYGEVKSFKTFERTSYSDLSANGKANCYIVYAAGCYRFKSTEKGNSAQSVGKPVSAKVLWESFGTDITPEVGDLVKYVRFDDGYVKFSTPKSLNNGNAVIAVTDDSGTILWSWHIWVCKDFDPAKTAQVYNNNAGTMMDRNLGATSATPGDVHALGLMYQWGRKDPFLGGRKIDYATDDFLSAASTLTWPLREQSNSINGTIAYAVAHPTTFINYNSKNSDWYYTGSSSTDNTRWQSSKTMYDPCPAGWRVPDGGESGVWSKAFGSSSSSSSFESGPWDDTNKGMNFGSDNGQSSRRQLGSASTIWYPATGYRDFGISTLLRVGRCGFCRSCTPLSYYAESLYFLREGDVSYSGVRTLRATGLPVRCLKDE